jgi:hypothetical protein
MADLPNLANPDENRSTVQARPQAGAGLGNTTPTDAPGLEVPEFIPRHANMEAAQEVQRILGLAGETARNIGDQIVAKKNAKDAAAGEADQAAGTQDPQLFKNSQAYHAAWSMAGAKSAATQLSQQMTDSVNNLFNDPNNPPTLDEVHQTLEGIISGAVLGPDGKPIGFGTPEAQMHVASTLAGVRDSILSQAVGKIKTDTDTKLINTSISNYVTDGIARLSAAGPYVTDAVRKMPAPDPLAPLPDPTASQVAGQAVSVTPAPSAPGGDAGFAKAMATVFKNEAGFNPQDRNGFPVNMGLNGKYITPAVLKKYGASDLQSVTQAQAAQIYKDRYWDKSGAADLPANLQTPFFDVYIRSAKVAQQALAQSGNDPAKFMQVAAAKFQSISKGDKYGPIWAHRDAALLSDAGTPASPTVDVATTAPNPQLPAPSHQSFVDFNGFLDALPPTVDKATATEQGLRSIIAMSEDNNDPRLLQGLEFLAQKDGTPTFTPEEQSLIVEHRNRIADMVEVKADKQLRQTQSDNFGRFLGQFVSGNTPSISSIRSAMDSGAISSQDGWALEQHITEEARVSRAESRVQDAERNSEIDSNLAPMLVEAASGSNAAAYTPDKITQMFQDGTLGEGKKAAARAFQLRNAANQGIKQLESSPEYSAYVAKIDSTFGVGLLPTNQGQAFNIFMNRTRDPNYNRQVKAYVLSDFKKRVDDGTTAPVAFEEAVLAAQKAYPQLHLPAFKAVAAQRIKELQAK